VSAIARRSRYDKQRAATCCEKEVTESAEKLLKVSCEWWTRLGDFVFPNVTHVESELLPLLQK
jgi:hypothetical protein